MDRPAAWIYIGTLLMLVLCLARGHRLNEINLWDMVRVAKDGKTFTDARKLFEVGSFAVSAVTFAYWAVIDRLSEWYVLLFMATWTGARYLRDREQRLNKGMDTKAERQTVAADDAREANR